jgi:hypothetical protein
VRFLTAIDGLSTWQSVLRSPAEPVILRTHAEAGWGCVPQVLFPQGQDVTMALYLSGQTPQMLIYGGMCRRL